MYAFSHSASTTESNLMLFVKKINKYISAVKYRLVVPVGSVVV